MSRPVESGRVYIVGAGPGDPELLTLRGAAVLGAADVVFHDQLVTEEVLGLARPTAELVTAGHRAGQAKRDQRAVAAAMADRARRGQVVCRLKGGDPFVFGRGGEDLEALLSEGVPWEVVPGVSSALAGPAAAGVPITHRGVARSVRPLRAGPAAAEGTKDRHSPGTSPSRANPSRSFAWSTLQAKRWGALRSSAASTRSHPSSGVSAGYP